MRRDLASDARAAEALRGALHKALSATLIVAGNVAREFRRALHVCQCASYILYKTYYCTIFWTLSCDLW